MKWWIKYCVSPNLGKKVAPRAIRSELLVVTRRELPRKWFVTFGCSSV